MTIKQTAAQLEIKPTSLQKNLKRWRSRPDMAYIFNRAGIKPEDVTYGLNDDQPASLIASIKQWYNSDGQEAPARETKEKPLIRPSSQPRTTKAKRVKVLQDDSIAIIAAGILIAADAVSCSWIAYHIYRPAWVIACPVFAAAGMAIGYSAFRNITRYDGYDRESWAWGFGIFQLLLHLSAMETFDIIKAGLSFPMAKVIIAIGLALSTGGIAVTLKRKK